MKKTLHRSLSTLLALVMLLSCLSGAVFAADVPTQAQIDTAESNNDYLFLSFDTDSPEASYTWKVNGYEQYATAQERAMSCGAEGCTVSGLGGNFVPSITSEGVYVNDYYVGMLTGSAATGFLGYTIPQADDVIVQIRVALDTTASGIDPLGPSVRYELFATTNQTVGFGNAPANGQLNFQLNTSTTVLHTIKKDPCDPTGNFYILTFDVSDYQGSTFECIRLDLLNTQIINEADSYFIDYIYMGRDDYAPAPVTYHYKNEGVYEQHDAVYMPYGVSHSLADLACSAKAANVGSYFVNSSGDASTLVPNTTTVTVDGPAAYYAMDTGAYGDKSLRYDPENGYYIDMDIFSVGESFAVSTTSASPLDITIAYDRSLSTSYPVDPGNDAQNFIENDDNHRVRKGSSYYSDDLAAALAWLDPTKPDGYYVATNCLGDYSAGVTNSNGCGSYGISDISFEPLRYRDGAWYVWQTVASSYARPGSVHWSMYYSSGGSTDVSRSGSLAGKWVAIEDAISEYYDRCCYDSSHPFYVSIPRRSYMADAVCQLADDLYALSVETGEEAKISIVSFGSFVYAPGETVSREWNCTVYESGGLSPAADFFYKGYDEGLYDIPLSMVDICLTDYYSGEGEEYLTEDFVNSYMGADEQISYNTSNGILGLEKIKTSLRDTYCVGVTATDLALERATSYMTTMQEDKEEGGAAGAVLLMTDGAPASSGSFTASVADAALAQASTLKESYTLFSVGFMDGLTGDAPSDGTTTGERASTFLQLASSNYSGVTTMAAYASAIPAEEANYYYHATTDGSYLREAFKKIMAVTQSSISGVKASLAGNIEIRDTVTDEFSITDVEYLKVPYEGDGSFSSEEVTAPTDCYDSTLNGNDIVVQFTDETAFLQEEAKEDGSHGYALRVRLYIEPNYNNTYGGNQIPTNKPGAGVYITDPPGDIPEVPYDIPKANVEIRFDFSIYDYFMDLASTNGKVGLAELQLQEEGTDFSSFNAQIYNRLYALNIEERKAAYLHFDVSSADGIYNATYTGTDPDYSEEDGTEGGTEGDTETPTLPELPEDVTSGASDSTVSDGNLLLNFLAGSPELSYNWAAQNASGGTNGITYDTTGCGTLSSTSNGGDHYLRITKNGTDSIKRTVNSGDILEIRYKTVNLPSDMVGAEEDFLVSHVDDTQTGDESLSYPDGADDYWTATVTRLEDTWQTVQFVIPEDVTYIDGLLVEYPENGTVYNGTTTVIDYFYLGAPEAAPSVKRSDSLFFDFTDDSAARSRYATLTYGNYDFDTAGQWYVNTDYCSVPTLDYTAGVMTTQYVSGSPYVQTIGDSIGNVLDYEANADDIAVVRFRLNGLTEDTAADGSSLRLSVRSSDRSDLSITDEALTWAMEDYCFDGRYVTARLENAGQFLSTLTDVSALRVTFEGITGSGSIDLDYIYVGPASGITELPQDNYSCTTYSVTNVWAGDPNPNQPTEVKVTLLRDGVAVETVLLTKENNWTYSWTQWSKEGDLAIVWSVKEVYLSSTYTQEITTEGSTFTITNTYQQPTDELVTMTVNVLDTAWDYTTDRAIDITCTVSPRYSGNDSAGQPEEAPWVSTKTANYYAPKFRVADFGKPVEEWEMGRENGISADGSVGLILPETTDLTALENGSKLVCAVPEILHDYVEHPYQYLSPNGVKGDSDKITERVFTLLPANVVAYEEGFLTKLSSGKIWDTLGTAKAWTQTQDKDALHGYSQNVVDAGNTGDSDSSSYTVNVGNRTSTDGTGETALMEFSFTGTGFDIISRTGPECGMMYVTVVNSAGTEVESFLLNTYLKAVTYYQIPVVHCMMEAHDTYTVTIKAFYNPGFDPNVEVAASASGSSASRRVELTETVAKSLMGLPANASVEYITAGSKTYANVATNATASYVGDYDVYVDGIRIYNTLGTLDKSADPVPYYAYHLGNEVNPTFTNVKDTLLGMNDWGKAAADGNSSIAGGMAYIAGEGGSTAGGSDQSDGALHLGSTGLLYRNADGYLMDFDGNCLTYDACCGGNIKVVYTDSTENPGTYNVSFQHYCTKENKLVVIEDTSTLKGIGDVFDDSAYDVAGPENEVYLLNGNGVAFSVSNASKVLISLKSPMGAETTLQAYCNDTWTDVATVSVATEMYYDITGHVNNGELILRCQSASPISICNLKLVGITETDTASISSSTDLLYRAVRAIRGIDLPEDSTGEESTLNIQSAYLTLNEDIDVNYVAQVSDDYADPYMVFTMNGEDFTVTDYSVRADGCLIFTFCDLQPNCMGDSITATLYADRNGSTDSATVADYSVRSYCINMLERYSDDAALVQLLSDLLVYGEKAQLYTNYRTDALVTADLELSPSEFAPVTETALSLNGTESPEAGWHGAGLVLENSLTTYFCFEAQQIEDLTLRVELNGRTVDFTAEDFVPQEDGTYRIYFRGIMANEFEDTLTASFLRNGSSFGRSVNYSVSSYVYAYQNCDDAALAQLVQALSGYGASALAYSQS